MSELAEGHLVAVECENCSSEPLLARIVKVFDTNIEVVWLDGEYDKPWKVAHHRDPCTEQTKDGGLERHTSQIVHHTL